MSGEAAPKKHSRRSKESKKAAAESAAETPLPTNTVMSDPAEKDNLQVRFPFAPCRENLGRFPSCVMSLDRSRPIPGGSHIDVKCEDEVSSCLGGGKLRKLEYLLHECRNQNCDAVIATGSPTSDLCRTVAIAAVRLGLQPVIYYYGDPPKDLHGNFFLSQFCGAEIHYFDPEQWAHDRQDELLEDARHEYEQRTGNKAYIIPPGATSALGMWGYINCLSEFMREGREFPYTQMWVPIGTGGMFAGLIVGMKLFELKNLVIHGVCVWGDRETAEARLLHLLDQFNEMFGTQIELDGSEYRIIEGFAGEGHGHPLEDSLEDIRSLATREGVFLETNYSAKAYTALRRSMENHEIGENERVIFFNTGGPLSLLSQVHDVVRVEEEETMLRVKRRAPETVPEVEEAREAHPQIAA